MPDLLRAGAAGDRSASWRSRARGPAGCTTPRACSTRRPTPPPLIDQGMRVERRYERFVENGDSAGGHLIRGRRSDPRDAHAHAAEGTAVRRRHRRAAGRRRGRGRLVQHDGHRPRARCVGRRPPINRSRSGGVAAGSITSRSTTIASRSSRRGSAKAGTSSRISCARRPAGTFRVTGTRAEEMYAPEVNGRTAPVTIEIK